MNIIRMICEATGAVVWACVILLIVLLIVSIATDERGKR